MQAPAKCRRMCEDARYNRTAGSTMEASSLSDLRLIHCASGKSGPFWLAPQLAGAFSPISSYMVQLSASKS